MNPHLERWRELSPLLDQALELDAASRDAWLVELRASQPHIERELRILLAEEDRLDEDDVLPGETFSLPTPRTSLAGMRLGAWQLKAPIGQGGMGTVWSATRTDGRFVGTAAVKLLNMSRLDDIGEARFRREGNVLARLSHPNIGRLLDAGVTSSDQPYLVLELVDGQPIDTFCAERTMSVEARIRLFLQVVDAVGHAHANLVVHRDIKPSNILVTADGTVKLLDFGIAALLAADPTGDGPVTIDGRQALTPEYAAPEQVTGGSVTTATDVYALGVLLYLLIAGHHPTAAGARSPAELVRALVEREPAPLGHGDLTTIVARALRKRPAERYQSVGAFADDLLRYLRHEPVSARPDSLAYRARKFLRRHRASTIGVTVAALGLMAATAVSVDRSREARRQRDAAVLERQRADAQVEFQNVLLSEVGERPLSLRELLDKARIVVERQYGEQAPFLPSMLAQLAQHYIGLADPAAAAPLLARAASLAGARGDSSMVAEVRCHQADLTRLDGAIERAARMLDEADAMLGRHPNAWSEVSCLMERAQYAAEAGDVAMEGRASRRAVFVLDSLDERGLQYESALTAFASALEAEGQPQAGVDTLRRALALMDSSGRGGTMGSAIARHNLGFTLNKLGQTADAERVHHQSLLITSRADPDGRIPVQPLIHYAQGAYVQQHYDSALKYFAVLAAQAVRDTNSYWEARALFGTAQTQIAQGLLAEARGTMERFRLAAARLRHVRTDDHLLDVRVLEARIALRDSQASRARALADSSLARYGYLDGKRHAVLHSTLMVAADAALRAGDADGALSYATHARDQASRKDAGLDARNTYLGEATLMMARAQLARGDTARARSLAAIATASLDGGAGPQHPLTAAARTLMASR